MTKSCGDRGSSWFRGKGPSRGEMEDGWPRCPYAEMYGVSMRGTVRGSRDWQRRIAAGLDFRDPRGWRWGRAMAKRARALRGSEGLRISQHGLEVEADVHCALTVGELAWACTFHAKAEDHVGYFPRPLPRTRAGSPAV